MDQYIFNIQSNVLSQLKIWHWQYTAFSSHVAIGELYESLSDILDTVVETWQGRTQSRIKIGQLERAPHVDFEGAEQAIELLSDAVEQTVAQVAELKKLDAFSDVINLLEELNGILGKTMYLLTLK